MHTLSPHRLYSVKDKNHPAGYSHNRQSGDTAPMKNRIKEVRKLKGVSLAWLEEATGIWKKASDD